MSIIKDIKSLPRSLWVLMLSVLVNRMGSMALIFMTLYLTQDLGRTPAEAGLIIAVYGIGSLIVGPFAGKLSDKIGEVKLIKLSIMLGGGMLLTFPLIQSYYFLLAYTFIWSLIAESFRPAAMSYISKSVEPSLMKTAFAVNRLAINLGMSIGPVLGGFLSTINFSLLFYVDGGTSILAGILLIAAKLPAIQKDEDYEKEIENKKFDVIAPHKNLKFLLFLASIIPVQMVFFQLLSTFPLFVVEDCGLSREMFGVLHSINTILIIIVEVPLNAAMKSWQDSKSMALGAFLFAAGFGAMVFANSFATLAITVAIWTFGEMILLPASSTFVAGIAPKKKVGEYMGFYQMSFGFSWTAAPWAGTQIYQYFGAKTLWLTAFILGSISSSGFLFTRKIKTKN